MNVSSVCYLLKNFLGSDNYVSTHKVLIALKFQLSTEFGRYKYRDYNYNFENNKQHFVKI